MNIKLNFKNIEIVLCYNLKLIFYLITNYQNIKHNFN